MSWCDVMQYRVSFDCFGQLSLGVSSTSSSWRRSEMEYFHILLYWGGCGKRNQPLLVDLFCYVFKPGLRREASCFEPLHLKVWLHFASCTFLKICQVFQTSWSFCHSQQQQHDGSWCAHNELHHRQQVIMSLLLVWSLDKWRSCLSLSEGVRFPLQPRSLHTFIWAAFEGNFCRNIWKCDHHYTSQPPSNLNIDFNSG